jgi:hypothetical protein
MTRCRACWVDRETKNQRDRLRRDADARAKANARRVIYGRESRAALSIKDKIRRDAQKKAA